MTDIAPLSHLAAAAFDFTAKASKPAATPGAPGRADDSVELSTAATFLAKLRDLPPRQGLIDQVKAEIDNGTYETDAKLDAAVQSLLEDL